MTSPEDAAYGINQAHLTVTLPSASADLGKPLEVEDWATLDWRPGLVAMIHGRIVFRPDGGDVIHCIGIGRVTAQASSWAGGWNEDAVDDSPPVDR